MVTEPIKRNRYFHPQGGPGGTDYTAPHTGEHHFQDYEELFEPLTRVDSSHLRGDWGIADGLEVSGAGGSHAIVGPGVAVDGQGRMIVLVATALNGIDGGHADVGANPPQNQHLEVPVPADVPIGGFLGSTVYVTIQFNEISRPSEGSGGRFEQVPWLRVQPTAGAGAYVDDGMSVILAIADVTAGGNLSNLRYTDAGLPHGRRVMGRHTGAVRLKRPISSAGGIDDEVAATLGGRDGGGLAISVPHAGDVVSVQHEGGGVFSTFEVHAGDVVARDGANRDVLRFDASQAELEIGTNGSEGHLHVRDAAARIVMDMQGNGARLNIGADGNAGDLVIRDSAGRQSLNFDGYNAWLRVGTEGNEGDLEVKDGSNRSVMHFNGSGANLRIGTSGNHGDLDIRDSGNRSVLNFTGHNAWLRVGANGNEGDIEVRDGSGRGVFHFDGNNAWLRVGTNGNEGDIEVQDGAGRRVMHMNGDNAALYLGASGNEGDLLCRNNAGTDTIHLDGGAGNIWSNGRLIAGNPARYVRNVWLYAADSTDTQVVDLGSTRQVYAFVVMTGCDPLAAFDKYDAFGLDVEKIDGAATSTFRYGGRHFGSNGSAANLRAQSYWGSARRITFRARSFDNAEVYGLGIVFHE